MFGRVWCRLRASDSELADLGFKASAFYLSGLKGLGSMAKGCGTWAGMGRAFSSRSWRSGVWNECETD